LRKRWDEQEQQINALNDRVRELERRNEALERAVAEEETKLTPRQRAIVEARLAEHDPNQPLH
jgi:chromosome segregation ATPase